MKINGHKEPPLHQLVKHIIKHKTSLLGIVLIVCLGFMFGYIFTGAFIGL